MWVYRVRDDIDRQNCGTAKFAHVSARPSETSMGGSCHVSGSTRIRGMSQDSGRSQKVPVMASNVVENEPRLELDAGGLLLTRNWRQDSLRR